ncbi:DNA-directed RNA polymerases I and III subunit RPAC1 [Chlorella sorokiniana]|uniref:Plastid-encoded RNA polymerase subunit alpha n=1 Tax=Chlorella sorokiniana TaxID=3076 RepID=A0A2P6TDH3_CHLSO|nr:DNA-directed RNA polymerases I and III subunit RPAC1 [Chlorella sorokiniana]|eukprot:PRW20693.1 DNA-directed RNA polymerases I and III subunit RPAC1 [Chlorella sorokiniana]
MPPRSAAARGFVRLLPESDAAFEEVFVMATQLLDVVWLERQATYMEFPVVLKEVQRRLEHGLASKHDEVLSHRLGLIPLKVDPRLFQYKSKEDAPSEQNTIVLKLKVECRRLPNGALENDKVYFSALQWLPEGSEMPDETSCRFASSQAALVPEGVRPVHADILVAKLRPGQAIELECHCIKGVGDEHAKWSPVATTWYRLMPEVVLLQQPRGQVAEELAEQLPGLLHLSGSGDKATVVVGGVRKHDKLLEKVRQLSGEERYAPYIQLRKIKDHFIFTIESTGAWRPHELFNYAVQMMVSKVVGERQPVVESDRHQVWINGHPAWHYPAWQERDEQIDDLRQAAYDAQQQALHHNQLVGAVKTLLCTIGVGAAAALLTLWRMRVLRV